MGVGCVGLWSEVGVGCDSGQWSEVSVGCDIGLWSIVADEPVGENIEVMEGDPVGGEVGVLVVAALGVVGCVWWVMASKVVCWQRQDGKRVRCKVGILVGGLTVVVEIDRFVLGGDPVMLSCVDLVAGGDGVPVCENVGVLVGRPVGGVVGVLVGLELGVVGCE